MSKIIFTLFAFAPLCWHSPYLLQAWRSSRLDQWDWIFYLAAIPAAIWAMRKEKLGKCDFYALFLLIPMGITGIVLIMKSGNFTLLAMTAYLAAVCFFDKHE